MEKDPRRFFSRDERRFLWLMAEGICQGCGVELEEKFHGDHRTPWSKGGATSLENGQALCASCDSKKGNKT